jgi:hypothetical protein
MLGEKIMAVSFMNHLETVTKLCGLYSNRSGLKS